MLRGILRGGERMPAFALFLLTSAVTVATIGLGFRLDGTLTTDEAEHLYILTWLIPPIVGLLVTWAVPAATRARLSAFGAGWIAFAVVTLYLAPAPIAFNRILGSLLPALWVGSMLVLFGKQSLWGALAGMIPAVAVVWGVFSPLTQVQGDSASIIIVSMEQGVILPGQINHLSWTAESIKSIYLNEQATVGAGETDFNTPQRLQISLNDDTDLLITVCAERFTLAGCNGVDL